MHALAEIEAPPGIVPRGTLEGLTEQQRAFVIEFVANGGKQTRAAQSAGYAHAGQAAHALMRLPHVRAAIAELVEIEVRTEGMAISWGVIKEILKDEKAPKHVRADLAKFTLRVGGITEAKPKEAEGSGGKSLQEMTLEELQAEVAKAQAALEKMPKANVIDVSPA